MIQDINDSMIISEVRSCFEHYNAAIENGDTDALNGFFWHSPSTIRFGPKESLFGYDEISNFRSKTWKLAASGRKVERLVISTFGKDAATTNAVIRATDGTASRQSQTWVRFSEGWRIVAANVSAAPL